MFHGDYFKSPEGVAIATGILLGVTMFLNVWGVIWPNQKKVIANARNVQAGGEADPAAADAGRRAALASRMNTIFSFPMLFFMVGAAHFFAQFIRPGGGTAGSTGRSRSSSGLCSSSARSGSSVGRAAGNITNWMFETHRAIGTGLVLVVVWYTLWEIIFSTRGVPPF